VSVREEWFPCGSLVVWNGDLGDGSVWRVHKYGFRRVTIELVAATPDYLSLQEDVDYEIGCRITIPDYCLRPVNPLVVLAVMAESSE